jgi:apoptosis-inducing factor 3
MSEESKLTGLDFSQGVPLADIAEGGMLLGHVADEPVLLARSGGEIFAIGAECTRYHGPLAEGLRVGDTIRSPGTTPVSACALARHYARQRSIRSRASGSSNGTGRSLSVTDSRRAQRGRHRPYSRNPSLSSVAVGGAGRGRDAAARRLCRAGYDAKRREREAL